jgi:DNA-binding MarR family transcriptional regulator
MIAVEPHRLSSADLLAGFGFLLKDVSRLYVQRFEQRARTLGFTLAQSKALIYLAKHEGISQAQLSELCDIEPMNLVRILDRMEADGWVERRQDPADRRARQLYIQPKARPLLDELQRVSRLTREEAFHRIPSADVEVLMDLLQRIQQNLGALSALATDSSPPPELAVRGTNTPSGATSAPQRMASLERTKL